MSKQLEKETPQSRAVELFEPGRNVVYTLDVAAHLAGVPRRAVLAYYRAGLVCPVFQAPYGVMAFSEEAIYTVRRIEHLRAIHGMDVALIKTILGLLDEVERLRAEVRFLRKS